MNRGTVICDWCGSEQPTASFALARLCPVCGGEARELTRALRERVAALEAAIREAPHEPQCAALFCGVCLHPRHWEAHHGREAVARDGSRISPHPWVAPRCSCWKRQALEATS